MKIEKRYKLDKFKGNGLFKNMNTIHKHNEHTVELTNGHILARIPAYNIKSEFYSFADYAKAKKGCKELEHIEIFNTDIEGNYPDTKNIDIGFKEYHKISLNPKLLYELSQIMGCEDQIILTFQEHNLSVVKVEPHKNTLPKNKAYGYIMPVRIDS